MSSPDGDGAVPLTAQTDAIRPVGERLRELRIGRRLTLKEVARRAGLSESFVSQLERGRSGTSLKTLQGLATALGVELGDLFDAHPADRARVIRRAERAPISIGSLSKYRITPGLTSNVEVIGGVFEPGGTAGEDKYTHGDSEEVVVVLDGAVRAEIGADSYELGKGDSLCFRSSVPHTFHATESGAEVIWIVSPPSY